MPARRPTAFMKGGKPAVPGAVTTRPFHKTLSTLITYYVTHDVYI